MSNIRTATSKRLHATIEQKRSEKIVMEGSSQTSNVRVETVTREDDVRERTQYQDITDAVERTLNTRLMQAEERTNLTIAEAVKKALDNKSSTQPSSSKRKMPDFRLKGNKKRYETNEEVITNIEEAIEEMDRGKLEEAKTKLDAGKKILFKQQKLIRLADREKNGWEVAKHYMSDDLASDSADEKAIKKARKEALATINKRKVKRRHDFRSYNKNWRRGEDARDKYPSKPYDRYYIRQIDRKKTDICFKCGKEGHWQNACNNVLRR